MFTVKNYFENGNYHAYGCVNFFVDLAGSIPLDGLTPDEARTIQEVALNANCANGHPRLMMEEANGSYRVIDVTHKAYIENAAGKTIDCVEPRPRNLPPPQNARSRPVPISQGLGEAAGY